MLKRIFKLFLLMCISGFLSHAQTVHRTYRDVDGDGMPEAILENDYLHVTVMTGEMPSVIPEPTILPDGRKVPYKYGDRFARGGWIYNIIFKPTNRKWFINDINGGEHRHGIPEEFEITQRMKEVEPGWYAAMKPSIGTGIGPNLCFRNSMKNMNNPPWSMREERLDNGAWSPADKDDVRPAQGWRLIFTHAIDTEYGYGCRYTKVLTMLDNDAALRCHRELANTGREPFTTSWYTHGFFSQGAENTHNQYCWSVLPLCPPAIPNSPFPRNLIDTERSFIRARQQAYYWGAKSQDEVGGSWHACGNEQTGDVFLTAVDRHCDFFRMWTCDNTYSYEPFLVLNLKGGETITWDTIRASGNGLTSVRAYGEGGMLDWQVTDKQDGKRALSVTFLPYKAMKTSLKLTGTITTNDKHGRMQTITVNQSLDATELSPVKPQTFTFDLFPKLPDTDICTVKLTLATHDAAPQTLVTVDNCYRLNATPRTAWKGNAQGIRGVIFTDTAKDDKGNCKHTMSTKFIESYLADAGFTMALTSATDAGDTIDWNSIRLVFITSRRISIQLLRKLEVFARNGGAVVVTGMIDYRQFELSDLLPIKGIYGECNTYASNPRDGTLEFVRQDDLRYQIKALAAHDITAGLPWYPESYQAIGGFQRVIPKQDSQVLLAFTPGPGMSDAGLVEYPALVIGKYGKGNVAYWGCPVAWGGHQSNCMWGRLGEYHRKFFVQLALWMIK